MESPTPYAVAMTWVGRIFAVCLIMVLPGLGGQALGNRLGAEWIGLVGFLGGLVLGMVYLIALTQKKQNKK